MTFFVVLIWISNAKNLEDYYNKNDDNRKRTIF